MNSADRTYAVATTAAVLLLIGSVRSYLPKQRAFAAQRAADAGLPPELSRVPPMVAAAVRAAHAATRERPADGAAWGEFALTLDANGFWPAAADAYERAAALQPQEAAWPYLHALGLSGLDRVRAAELLRRAAELSPGDAVVPVRLANLLLRMGKLPESESVFKAVLRVDPQSLHARLGLAKLALLGGKLEEASRQIDATRPFEGRHRDLIETAARIAAARGNADEARRLVALAAAAPSAPSIADRFVERRNARRVAVR